MNALQEEAPTYKTSEALAHRRVKDCFVQMSAEAENTKSCLGMWCCNDHGGASCEACWPLQDNGACQDFTSGPRRTLGPEPILVHSCLQFGCRQMSCSCAGNRARACVRARVRMRACVCVQCCQYVQCCRTTHWRPKLIILILQGGRCTCILPSEVPMKRMMRRNSEA